MVERERFIVEKESLVRIRSSVIANLTQINARIVELDNLIEGLKRD